MPVYRCDDTNGQINGLLKIEKWLFFVDSYEPGSNENDKDGIIIKKILLFFIKKLLIK